MTIKMFIPRESTALSLGANDVADALKDYSTQHEIELNLIRNGSRGLFWLEPMVEIETLNGRFAYGPVEASDVSSIMQDILTNVLSNHTQDHRLALGLTEELAFLKKQTRLTFARAGITDPLSLDDYLAMDGFTGLRNAL
ncbi:MAG: formate dehydrogenase, partial [Sinobacterium sp.]